MGLSAVSLMQRLSSLQGAADLSSALAALVHSFLLFVRVRSELNSSAPLGAIEAVLAQQLNSTDSGGDSFTQEQQSSELMEAMSAASVGAYQKFVHLLGPCIGVQLFFIKQLMADWVQWTHNGAPSDMKKQSRGKEVRRGLRRITATTCLEAAVGSAFMAAEVKRLVQRNPGDPAQRATDTGILLDLVVILLAGTFAGALVLMVIDFLVDLGLLTNRDPRKQTGPASP